MLRPGLLGVELVKDWHPAFIGRSAPANRALCTTDCCKVQQALLKRRLPTLPEPRPVPMLDTVEKLVDFFSRPQPWRN